MVAVDAISNMLASVEEDCKAIKFVSNLKGALMGPVAALLSHGGGEDGGSGGAQKVLPQGYCFFAR